MAGVKESEWMYRIRGLGPNYETDRAANALGMERELQSRGIVPIINPGAVHENPTDRMFAQARAAANAFKGEAEAFNSGALGDSPFVRGLLGAPDSADAAVESERNKAAGDLGRRLGAARRYEIDRAAKMRREQLPVAEWLKGLFGR